MAYLVSIDHHCQTPGCESRATQRLFNWVNAKMSDYCKRHSAGALREQQAREDRAGTTAVQAGARER